MERREVKSGAKAASTGAAGIRKEVQPHVGALQKARMAVSVGTEVCACRCMRVYVRKSGEKRKHLWRLRGSGRHTSGD